MPKTDIMMILDIPTKGRTREQIKAQLQQKIKGFHEEATRRYKSLGYSLKVVDVFEKEPDKRILITDLVDPLDALKLQEALVELWNKIARPDECKNEEPSAIFERLVEELVDICYKGVWLQEGKNPRVVEIGRELYLLANMKIVKMREAAGRVSYVFGACVAEDLSHHWHEIGLKEWQFGKGEFWMA